MMDTQEWAAVWEWLTLRGYKFHMADGEYLVYHSGLDFVFYHDSIHACGLAALENCGDSLFIKYRWITLLRKELS
jgi:hypothetical protein